MNPPEELRLADERNGSREEDLFARESAVEAREEALLDREEGARLAWLALDAAMADLREANEHLIVANVGSHTLAEVMGQSLREAAMASQAKDDFFALLSHELRTPLTSITGWADLLGRNPDHDTIVEAARSIAISAALQAKLVDDLLDVSRILTGKFSITDAELDLDLVVGDSVSAAHPAAIAKGLSLRITSLQSIQILGDASRLRQAVGNLLANSVKFTPAGGMIEVRLTLDGPVAVIEVCDTGEGIPGHFLSSVFDRNAQADSRRFGGLGLGLAIVKHIVEMHGGSVLAASEGEGKGSTFTVRLPTHKGL